MKKKDIYKRLAAEKKKADLIKLLSCPHCGGKAEMVIEVWGSIGDDRLVACVACSRGIIQDAVGFPHCWARGGALQESPRFLETAAEMWNRRT